MRVITWMLRSGVAALALAICAGTFAAPPAGGDEAKVTVTGKLTCTFCKLANPDLQCAKKDCCVHCIKAGDPPLLTAADGQQYILLTSTHEMPLMTPARYKLVGGSVKVEGLLVKGQGVQAIKVSTMEKAEPVASK